MDNISNPLDFELPLVELERELEAIKEEISGGNQDRQGEYAKLEQRVLKLRKDVYGKLSRYQKVQLSRHFDRPFTLDLVNLILTDFVEFHGDRLFREDPAIVGGTGKLDNMPIMLIGHQRGRTTKSRLKRNFGMPQPEGYRKAQRLFKLAERFGLPLVTFIDTQGAYPGLEAEERGQAEAIARNLSILSELRVPIICVVIGEGGSGGALALGVADRILMLENACYSVITPEGCASILWHKNRDEAPETHISQAAEVLQLTAEDLKRFGLVEEVVKEPDGGAHRNIKESAEFLKEALKRHLAELQELDIEECLNQRYGKFRKMGMFTGDGK